MTPTPTRLSRRLLAATIAAVLVAGCATTAPRGASTGVDPSTPRTVVEDAIVDDAAILEVAAPLDADLLTAGLGEAGLRSPLPPPIADPAAPTALELRRRALWTNWRGIADLAPGGGYGTLYGTLAPVPGREFHAFATLPGRAQPHRLMVQVPDAFDADARCVVVAASSGSRGIHGAIALAGAWGLPRGCAVAYTDKGAGTGHVDRADGRGVGLDGRVADIGAPVEFAVPAAPAGTPPAVAMKHAQSGDNPEADWGRHVAQAARFARQVLQRTHPGAGPWTEENTRVVAVGVSNGGGAVLRAAELDGAAFDAVVAISPNVLPGDGGRALYDYDTEAAIWLPCALNAGVFDGVAFARPGGAPSPAGALRCASLRADGRLVTTDAGAQAEEARNWLEARGWTDDAIAAAAVSTAFDLWRAVGVTYAGAYTRSGPTLPCGYAFAATGADGLPRPPTPAERAAWWSDSSGIAPGAGIGIVDTLAAGDDPALPGLRCLRALWDDESSALRTGVAATRAALPRAGLPVIVVHGADDGLVPEAFSGGAYARWADANGRPVTYWRVDNAQHFDAFLGLPPLAARYVPLLPYAYRALDAAWATVADGAALPGDTAFATTPRAAGAPLAPANLGF
jgi:hydroxybutyrate-dimer hydrolase